MKKRFLLVSTYLFIGFLQAQNIQIDRYEETIKSFEEENKKLPLSQERVVLWGSSSFTNWKNFHAHLAPYNVINRGFGGSTAAEAIYYFDRVVVPLKPKIIFYYEGDNDIPAGFSVDSIFVNYRKMVAMVKKKLPGTKFVALSVKYSPLRKKINRATEIIERHGSRLCTFKFRSWIYRYYFTSIST